MKNDINKKSLFFNQKNDKNFIWKIIVMFWFLFFLGLISIFFIFYGTYIGLFGPMPNINDLDNPDKFVASEIISSDGVILDKFEKKKIIPIEYNDLPSFLVNALLAKEDKRFFQHTGIDIESIFRVIYYRGNRGGGSTLTQQLAKMLFTIQIQEEKEANIKKNKNWFEKRREFQKLKEWIISIELEKRYTKEEIIQMYFNKFDYLNNAIGIQMASKIYFQKNVKDLNLNTAATLVGMFENPNKYNPISNPKNAKIQRNLVLKLMKEQGKISNTEYNKTIKEPIIVNFKKLNKPYKRFSGYFKYHLLKDIDKYLNQYKIETGEELNLYKDGLKIYVTIDSRMQKYAEEAIKEHLTILQKSFFKYVKGKKNAPFSGINRKKANQLFETAMKRTKRYRTYKTKGISDKQIIDSFKKPIRLEIFTWNGSKDTLMSPWDSIRYHKHIINTGLMAMEPITGNIKAWVGGVDWNYFKYDHVKQAKRQVGSSFKPFVYATLISNNGYTPCSMISNSVPLSLSWIPKGSGSEITTIKTAIAKSLNGCAVNAMKIAGIKNTIKLCKNLGIESKIEPNLTSALGSCDLSVFEMVGAYSAFANYGTYIRPEMIWRIENIKGKVIKEYIPKRKEVLKEIHAYLMIKAMEGVSLYGGTGEAAKLYINTEISGKTGTSNQNADGWFIGITPKLTCGVWVGWEDRDTHFNNHLGQGSKSALPIWGIFMKKVYNNIKLGYSLQDKFISPLLYNYEIKCNEIKHMQDNNDNNDENDIQKIKSNDSIREEDTIIKDESKIELNNFMNKKND